VAIVVIGGQASNVGKTSVVCTLIAAMPERRWTAIKITQCKHDEAGTCDCELAGRALAISEEADRTSANDTSRYLAAGAVRSLWVRTRRGRIAEAMPQIRTEVARATNVIFESNSVVGLLQPDLYAMVLDPRIADVKTSAAEYLERADAILLVSGVEKLRDWPGVSTQVIERIPKFPLDQEDYQSHEFFSFVAQKLERAGRSTLPTPQ
jgi:hypothetical protein